MPTIQDVAELAGVSTALVSYVLNGTRRVSPELRTRVEQAVQELDYKPNLVAKNLRKGETRSVVLLIPAISNPFFSDIILGAEKCARRYGYHLLLCSTSEDPANEEFYISVLLSRGVDGLLLAPTPDGLGHLEYLIQKKASFVIIDRCLEEIPADQVFSDNIGGAEKAINHLIQLGHKKIGVIAGFSQVRSYTDRITGYRRALEQHGLPFDESLVVQADPTPEGGYWAIGELLTRHPDITAVFSTSGMLTLGLIRFLRENGIAYPNQISIVDFDDPIWNPIFEPGITSVAQKPYEMGERAMEFLVQRINAKRQQRHLPPRVVQLETKLVVRNSTGPPPDPLAKALRANLKRR